MTQAVTGRSAVSNTKTLVQGPTICLTFKDRAEEAIHFYVSLFRNSRILNMVRSDGKGPITEGRVMQASFQLDGREFVAFDGGSSFSFTDGISLMVTCDTQEEIDEIWAKLSEGGKEGPCGWLKDRFGVSWQVVPSELGHLLGDPASGNSAKAMEAMLGMGKLDIATLKQAYGSSS